MAAMFIIFFVEFASSRYLAAIDEKVLAMQIKESGCHDSIIQPIKALLARRQIIMNGTRMTISEALASEAAKEAAEIIIRDSVLVMDEETPLLVDSEGIDADEDVTTTLRKTDSRRDSHCGHHHYDPPPVDGSAFMSHNDVTRKSQLLAVAIMEGGLCFHSIFVGLTLAVATGSGFISLLTAIMFHRMHSTFVADRRNV
jgi:ZIP Zinc transporter